MGSPVNELQERCAAVLATGCRGSADYREWARQKGFLFLEIFDWTSSAGDWSFLVSRNGKKWYMMFQENNFPQPGFTRTIDTSKYWKGTAEKVIAEICDKLRRE